MTDSPSWTDIRNIHIRLDDAERTITALLKMLDSLQHQIVNVEKLRVNSEKLRKT